MITTATPLNLPPEIIPGMNESADLKIATASDWKTEIRFNKA